MHRVWEAERPQMDKKVDFLHFGGKKVDETRKKKHRTEKLNGGKRNENIIRL